MKVSDIPNELIGAFRTIYVANFLMFTLGYFYLQTAILIFTFAIQHVLDIWVLFCNSVICLKLSDSFS